LTPRLRLLLLQGPRPQLPPPTDNAPTGARNDNSDDRTPDWEAGGDNSGGDEAALP
jgi:hypothetical protein